MIFEVFTLVRGLVRGNSVEESQERHRKALRSLGFDAIDNLSCFKAIKLDWNLVPGKSEKVDIKLSATFTDTLDTFEGRKEREFILVAISVLLRRYFELQGQNGSFVSKGFDQENGMLGCKK